MYRKLGKSLREYRKPAILGMGFMALEVLMEVMIPFLMAKVLDEGFQRADTHYILKMGLLMSVIALLSMTFGILSGRFSAIAAGGLACNLRQDIYENIQTFSFQNMDKFSTPSLITRLTTDIANIQMAFQLVLKIIVRAPFLAVFAFAMAALTNVSLAVKILFVAPILGVVLVWIVFRVHPYFVEVFHRYDLLNQMVQEDVNGARVIKSYVQEEEEIKKFKDASARIRDLFIKAEKITALNSPLIQIAAYGALLMIYWYGAQYIVGHQMATGELASFITYMMLILNSMMMISMIFVMTVISEASVERVAEVLSEESSLKNPENGLKSLPDGSVEFRHVDFQYYPESPEPDLKDINFKIASGETIGIIGGTGSGKSSLIQLIPRLYDATRGEVLVGGHDVKEYDLVVLRDQIAMVLQKNTLFSGTIAENLRWGDEQASDAEIEAAAEIAQANSFIQTFPEQYETQLDQGGTNVSGGQKQRLTIARALLKKPKILILDDSTSAVDTKTERFIREALDREIADTTKIIVAQRISSVEQADRIIVMDEGRIHGIGTHEELLKSNHIYREVYDSQMKGGSLDE